MDKFNKLESMCLFRLNTVSNESSQVNQQLSEALVCHIRCDSLVQITSWPEHSLSCCMFRAHTCVLISLAVISIIYA